MWVLARCSQLERGYLTFDPWDSLGQTRFKHMLQCCNNGAIDADVQNKQNRLSCSLHAFFFIIVDVKLCDASRFLDTF